MNRVIVGVPSSDVLHADFAMCLANMAHKSRDTDLVFVNAKSSIVANGRNLVISAAAELQATAILFLDSDLTFPPDTVSRLLSHELDIVGAVYRRRSHPHDVLGRPMRTADDSSRPLVEMAEMPAGCLLIRIGVLSSFRQPVFRFEADEVEGTNSSEDYVFSRAARERGCKLWCDTRLSHELGHIGSQTLRLR